MADLRTVFADVPTDHRRFGVIGWPLGYSLSPAMQNAAIARFGFRAVYRAVKVAPADWTEFLETVGEQNGLEGFNVTIPYKEKILALASSVHSSAALCGAANTLVRGPRGWKAFSTDGQGLLDDLREKNIAWEGKSVVLLGAGGAARAAFFALGKTARSIALVNRSRGRAENLAKEFRSQGAGAEVQVNPGLREALEGAELLVNATSVGLGEGDPSPVPRESLRASLAVYDMVYHRETALVKDGRAAGAAAVGGLGMLVQQGAQAFELWFGEDLKKVKYDPPELRGIMASAASAALKERTNP